MPVLFTTLRKKRFLYILLFTLLIICVSALTFYATFYYMHLESVKITATENVKQIAGNYFSAVESLRGIANQIYHEQGNDEYLKENVGHVEKFFYLNRLSRYLYYNRYMESLIILKDGEIYEAGLKGLLPDPLEYINAHCDATLPLFYRQQSASTSNKTIYTFIYYETKETDGSVKNAVMLTLNERWAEQFYETGGGHLFAFDQNGSCCLTTRSTLSYPELLKAAPKLLDSDAPRFGKIAVPELQKEDFYYIRQPIDRLEFILLAREDGFVNSFKNTLNLTIIISLSFCTLILLVAFLYRIFYKKIVTEMRRRLADSENRFLDSRDQLKMNFLFRQLTDPEPEQLLQKASELEIAARLAEPIRLVLFEIDAYSHFLARYSQAEQMEIKKQCIHVIHDTLSPLRAEAVRIEEQRLLFLLNDKENICTVSLFKTVGEQLSSRLSVSVSCFVSQPGMLDTDGIELYEAVLSAKKQKLLAGVGCVVFCEDHTPPKKSLSIQQFYEKEQLITDFIKNGQVENAHKVLHHLLFEDLPGHNLDGALTMVKKMLFSVCLETEKKSGNKNQSYLSKIDSLESIQEAEELFVEFTKRRVVEDFASISATERIIAAAEQFIDEHFQDPMLSVSMIADSVRLSAGYLGQLYRKHRGESINDAINARRVERARCLLENTERPVMDIAESVGITSKTHLYNLFKKYYGTTPSNIRKNAQT